MSLRPPCAPRYGQSAIPIWKRTPDQSLPGPHSPRPLRDDLTGRRGRPGEPRTRIRCCNAPSHPPAEGQRKASGEARKASGRAGKPSGRAGKPKASGRNQALASVRGGGARPCARRTAGTRSPPSVLRRVHEHRDRADEPPVFSRDAALGRAEVPRESRKIRLRFQAEPEGLSLDGHRARPARRSAPGHLPRRCRFALNRRHWRHGVSCNALPGSTSVGPDLRPRFRRRVATGLAAASPSPPDADRCP